MRNLKHADVTFTLEILEENRSPEQEFSYKGTDLEQVEIYKGNREFIRAEIDKGNPYAWFVAKVAAEWEGIKGVAYLGGCSYKSRVDFEQCGYYEDLMAEALADLNENVEAYLKRAKELAAKLEACY